MYPLPSFTFSILKKREDSNEIQISGKDFTSGPAPTHAHRKRAISLLSGSSDLSVKSLYDPVPLSITCLCQLSKILYSSKNSYQQM